MEPVRYFHLYGVTVKNIEGFDTQIAEGDGSAIAIKVTLSYLYYRTDGSEVIYSE